MPDFGHYAFFRGNSAGGMGFGESPNQTIFHMIDLNNQTYVIMNLYALGWAQSLP